MYTLFLSFAVYLSIFLLGIAYLRYGCSGITQPLVKEIEKHQTILNGLWLGFFLTLLLQSSSASIALFIIFFASTSLSIPFIISYLIGANVATTITSQLFVWNDQTLMFICLLAGLILIFNKRNIIHWVGAILLGLGVIYSSLLGFRSLSIFLDNPLVEQSLLSGQPLIQIITGILITSIVQSSTVLTGILMSINDGTGLSLVHIYYLLLGANIGTCISVWIVTLTQPSHTRIIAYAHILMNIIGAFIAYPAIVSGFIIQWSESITSSTDQQIVYISFLYNLFTGLIFLIFIKPISRTLGLLRR
ncbi:hypothetical protein CEY16_04600 [Halalkalibacillus sediminis]|uniref:Na/Pi cotransporter n=1 Tax=Halalkalibacillus sediminis TaxID=2018042 RepID=A0A2I0QXI8_9BACI|nr:Na/Pi symporter [Halalkalibacillus sediminis]PKR79035.1 hypothetical protein CEY16_04600 [Halalkalibacillus sediminis]